MPTERAALVDLVEVGVVLLEGELLIPAGAHTTVVAFKHEFRLRIREFQFFFNLKLRKLFLRLLLLG